MSFNFFQVFKSVKQTQAPAFKAVVATPRVEPSYWHSLCESLKQDAPFVLDTLIVLS